VLLFLIFFIHNLCDSQDERGQAKSNSNLCDSLKPPCLNIGYSSVQKADDRKDVHPGGVRHNQVNMAALVLDVYCSVVLLVQCIVVGVLLQGASGQEFESSQTLQLRQLNGV